MLHVLATLAECERELLVERVNAGIAAARESGTRFGRPPVTLEIIAEKLALVPRHIAAEAAALFGWSRATLYRYQSETRRRVPSPQPWDCWGFRPSPRSGHRSTFCSWWISLTRVKISAEGRADMREDLLLSSQAYSVHENRKHPWRD